MFPAWRIESRWRGTFPSAMNMGWCVAGDDGWAGATPLFYASLLGDLFLLDMLSMFTSIFYCILLTFAVRTKETGCQPINKPDVCKNSLEPASRCLQGRRFQAGSHALISPFKQGSNINIFFYSLHRGQGFSQEISLTETQEQSLRTQTK